MEKLRAKAGRNMKGAVVGAVLGAATVAVVAEAIAIGSTLMQARRLDMELLNTPRAVELRKEGYDVVSNGLSLVYKMTECSATGKGIDIELMMNKRATETFGGVYGVKCELRNAKR